MGFSYNVNVLNQKGSPALYTDTFANRPAFGYKGRLFIANDTSAIYEDTGTAWVLIANVSSGAGTLQQVTTNGNTSNVGISITAGGLSTNSLTDTALTLGSVLFAGAAGLVTQDNASFYWDDTNNRLGINTITPSNTLDVHFAGAGASIGINNTAGNPATIVFANTGTNKWRIGNSSTNSFDLINVGLSSNAISVNSANNITQFGGDVYLPENSTVGGPNRYLYQKMASNDYWNIYGNTIAADQGELVFEVGDNGAPSPSNGQRFRFYYNASTSGTAKNALIIDYDNSIFNTNLGIGGTPSYPLDVTGAARLTGSLYTAGIYFTTNNTPQTVQGTITAHSIVGLVLRGITGTVFDFSLYSASGNALITNSTGTENISFTSSTGVITINNLAGTGSRAVLASASGVLSAPVSDVTVKENVKPLKYGLDAIMQLNPISFEYIEDYKDYGEGLQIGNIAQDVAKVIPEAVFTTPSTGLMGINYNQFDGIYIKAIQELNNIVQNQNTLIQSLITRIELLENK